MAHKSPVGLKQGNSRGRNKTNVEDGHTRQEMSWEAFWFAQYCKEVLFIVKTLVKGKWVGEAELFFEPEMSAILM